MLRRAAALAIFGAALLVPLPARAEVQWPHRTVSDDLVRDTLLGEKPTAPEVRTYTVESGDTARNIAERFQIALPTLLGANPALAEEPDRLFPGTTLTILPTNGVLATVADGESLAHLAATHGVSSHTIASANGLAQSELLAPGQRLVLPGVQPSLPEPRVAQPAPHEGEQQAASVMAMRPLVALDPFNLLWPALGQITTYFGEVGPTSPRGHAGLDIAAPLGTPIRAAQSGLVTRAHDAGAYGLLVVLEHEPGFETWYAHLSRFAVEVGEWVDRGQIIGRMGSTGYSTGSHLHFEVRENGRLRDPMRYLQ